jgi:hypothetical protein
MLPLAVLFSADCQLWMLRISNRIWKRKDSSPSHFFINRKGLRPKKGVKTAPSVCLICGGFVVFHFLPLGICYKPSYRSYFFMKYRFKQELLLIFRFFAQGFFFPWASTETLQKRKKRKITNLMPLRPHGFWLSVCRLQLRIHLQDKECNYHLHVLLHAFCF